MPRIKQPSIVRAGLDVGAAELVVALLRDGQPEPACTLPNTPAGHRQLLKLLTGRGATARVCLEATGVYSLNLALTLERAARVEVMVVNPRAIKDFQRARLTRAKTDRVDALGILQFLLRMEFVPWTPPSSLCLSLQQVSRRLLQLREELTREQARLHAVEFTPDRDGLIAAVTCASTFATCKSGLKPSSKPRRHAPPASPASPRKSPACAACLASANSARSSCSASCCPAQGPQSQTTGSPMPGSIRTLPPERGYPVEKTPMLIRRIPTIEQFEAIVESIRSQRCARFAQYTADFVAFLGLAGLGQAEASSLTWGDVDLDQGRLNIRRHKTDTRFVDPTASSAAAGETSHKGRQEC